MSSGIGSPSALSQDLGRCLDTSSIFWKHRRDTPQQVHIAKRGGLRMKPPMTDLTERMYTVSPS